MNEITESCVQFGVAFVALMCVVIAVVAGVCWYREGRQNDG